MTQKVVLFLALFSSLAWGQCVIGLSQPRVVFDGGLLWTMKPDRVTLETQVTGEAAKELVMAGGGWFVDVADGLLWRARRRPEGDDFDVLIESSPNAHHWNEVACLKHVRGGGVLRLFPLGGDWFVLEHLAPLGMGKNVSLWALAKANHRKELEVRELADMQLPSPFLDRSPGRTRELSTRIEISEIAKAYRGMAADFVARVPEGLVFASGHTGFLWIFTRGEGSPKVRMVPLFPAVSQVLAKNPGGLEWSILGMQPMPDGSVLIASRSEHAVLFARSDEKTTRPWKLTDFTSALFQSKREREIESSLRDFPEIHWWHLDVPSGRIQRAAPPIGVAERLTDLKRPFDFGFRPKVNGDLAVFGQ